VKKYQRTNICENGSGIPEEGETENARANI
jgi:hypothetical protein